MTQDTTTEAVDLPHDEPRQIVCTGEAGSNQWNAAFGTWEFDEFGMESDETVGEGERLFVNRRLYDALAAERDTLAKQAEDCARTCAQQAEEIRTLTRQLAEARNAALEEVIFLVSTWEQGAIEGGIFEQLIGWLTSRIRALKSEPAPRHLDDECQRCGSVGGFGCYECTPAPRQSVQEAAKVLLEWTGDYIPTVPKLAAVKAHLAHDNKTQPVAISAAWIAALQAIAQEAQGDE